MIVKKELEKIIQETQFGKPIHYLFNEQLSVTEQKQYFRHYFANRRPELISYQISLKSLTQALLYLTNSGTTPMQIEQYEDLYDFVKQHYPQTMYGHDEISKGIPFWHYVVNKTIKDHNIPITTDVKRSIEVGLEHDMKMNYQELYMRLGLSNEEAGRIADQSHILWPGKSQEEDNTKFKLLLSYVRNAFKSHQNEAS